MRSVKEIRFIFQAANTLYTSQNGDMFVVRRSSGRTNAFLYIERILEDFGITPDIARIRQFPFEMAVTISYRSNRRFTYGDSQKLLNKLEKMYLVTKFEVDTEDDDWDDSKAHVSYSFREKFEN